MTTRTARPSSGMDATDNTGKAPGPELAAAPAAEGGTAASTPVSDHPLGPDAVAILATEHWSLMGARSLLWNEAYSRTTIFLGALSAAIVALALLTNATGFGPRTATVALVLLPVVFFLGIATHIRMVEINQAEIALMLAMNRLRNAYLRIAPALEPYFSTSPHDDERGLTASYLSFHGRGLRPGGHFLSNTATVIATMDAALAAVIAVLAAHKAGAAMTLAVAVGAVAFLVVWTALFLLQQQSRSALRRSQPRFPTPPYESLSDPGRPYLRRRRMWCRCGAEPPAAARTVPSPWSARAVATRYDKLAVRYEATVCIAAINEWLLPHL